MKLLLLIDHLSSGGAQRQLVLLACRIAARGHSDSVAVYREHAFHAQALRDAGVAAHRLETRARARPGAALGRVRALVRLLDAEAFEAVVSFLSGPNLYALLASRRAKQRPLVVVAGSAAIASTRPSASVTQPERLCRVRDSGGLSERRSVMARIWCITTVETDGGSRSARTWRSAAASRRPGVSAWPFAPKTPKRDLATCVAADASSFPPMSCRSRRAARAGRADSTATRRARE